MDPIKNPYSPGAGSPAYGDMGFTVPLFDQFMNWAILDFTSWPGFRN
jgi:hypothetical protein